MTGLTRSGSVRGSKETVFVDFAFWERGRFAGGHYGHRRGDIGKRGRHREPFEHRIIRVIKGKLQRPQRHRAAQHEHNHAQADEPDAVAEQTANAAPSFKQHAMLPRRGPSLR